MLMTPEMRSWFLFKKILFEKRENNISPIKEVVEYDHLKLNVLMFEGYH